MPTVITATARFRTEDIETVRAAAVDMMAASKAEEGCLDYAFAQDLAEPDVFRIVEIWEDDAALARHFGMPHMAVFQETLASAPPLSIEATRHVTSESGPLDVAAIQAAG